MNNTATPKPANPKDLVLANIADLRAKGFAFRSQARRLGNYRTFKTRAAAEKWSYCGHVESLDEWEAFVRR